MPDPHAAHTTADSHTSDRRSLLTRAGPIGLGLGAAAALAVGRSEPAHAAPADAGAGGPWTEVLDHGLVADGSTDCAVPLRRLLRQLQSGSATLHFPAGSYRFRSPVTVPATIGLVLDRGAVLAPEEGRTLTLDGPIVAGPYQVFGGAGEVTGSFPTSPVLPQWWGALGDGEHDDAPAFNAALRITRTAGSVAIRVPRGRYRIAGRLRIYRNTHLRFDPDAVLVRGWAAGFFINGDDGASYPGYSGHGSIVIDGGTLDGNIGEFPSQYVAMSLGHCEDVTIRNLTITDVVWGHAVEVNASRNVTFSNCRFLGYRDADDGSRFFSEAIQLDLPTKLGFPAFGPWDGTPCRDITVENCHFGPSGTDDTTSWPCGVGTHGTVHDVWTSGVRIVGNTFDRCTWYAVRPFKWNDLVVTGNHLVGCAGGITHSTPAPNTESTKDADGVQHGTPQGSARVVIADNVITGTTTSASISAYGRAEAGPTDVLIHGNQITDAAGTAIHATHCRGIRVSDNVLDAVVRGVDIADSSGVVVTDNTVTGAAGHGVRADTVNDFAVDGNWVSGSTAGEDGEHDGIALLGCTSGTVRSNAVRAGEQRYGLSVDQACEQVTTSANLLAGSAAPYHCESGSSHDQVELYSPSGAGFALSVSDDGEVVTRPLT